MYLKFGLKMVAIVCCYLEMIIRSMKSYKFYHLYFQVIYWNNFVKHSCNLKLIFIHILFFSVFSVPPRRASTRCAWPSRPAWFAGTRRQCSRSGRACRHTCKRTFANHRLPQQGHVILMNLRAVVKMKNLKCYNLFVYTLSASLIHLISWTVLMMEKILFFTLWSNDFVYLCPCVIY